MQNVPNNLSPNINLRLIIAENLKKVRQKHNLSQRQLAKLCNIHYITISRYETCNRTICLEHLLCIAKTLGESPLTFLMGWEEI